MNDSCFTIYSQLFIDVQHSRIFSDSKTFADAIPKLDPQIINELYNSSKSQPGFDLKQFVESTFTLPEYVGGDILRKPDGNFVPIEEYVWNSWTILTRANIVKDVCDTEIQVPSPYVVPGGRFREMFYWDSYFTALGLVVHHRYDLLFALANNFKFLVEQFGYIPNGTRTYFIGRSQPPVYSLLIDLICKHVKEDYWKDHLVEIEKQYLWWMRGEDTIQPNTSHLHLMNINGSLLNRYYQDVHEPRPEAYQQEEHFLESLDFEQKKQLYPELRAGAESGWDFSGRWFSNPHDITTIRASQYAPCDLNSMLYITERNLSRWYALQENHAKSEEYITRANNRNKAIRKYLYNSEVNFYTDHLLNEGPTNYRTLAGIFPLFAGIATTQEAEFILAQIEKEFLQKGGLVTSLCDSGEQWDYPNGWAPLQYVAVIACQRYGAFELAKEIKKRFCHTIEETYAQMGTLLEKYNVVDPTAKPQDGEYELQTGFGWTNGVYTWFIRH